MMSFRFTQRTNTSLVKNHSEAPIAILVFYISGPSQVEPGQMFWPDLTQNVAMVTSHALTQQPLLHWNGNVIYKMDIGRDEEDWNLKLTRTLFTEVLNHFFHRLTFNLTCYWNRLDIRQNWISVTSQIISQTSSLRKGFSCADDVATCRPERPTAAGGTNMLTHTHTHTHTHTSCSL